VEFGPLGDSRRVGVGREGAGGDALGDEVVDPARR
jgi:hypothetical protein